MVVKIGIMQENPAPIFITFSIKYRRPVPIDILYKEAKKSLLKKSHS